MNVLVVGASRGIGHEFVRQHLAAGDRVGATARAAADVENFHARLRLEQFVRPRVDVGGAVFFMNVDAHQ